MRELEDPDELEDLQMILSLADDVDEEFMEDVTLEEAEAFEVKELTSFLQRLSSSCEVWLVRREQRGEKMPLKLLMAILGIVTELRKTEKNPEKREQSLASLTEGNASSILHFRTGKKCQNSQKSGLLFWQGQSKADGHSEKDSLKCGNCQYQIS